MIYFRRITQNGISFEYAYDNRGSITSKAKYTYTTGALGAAVETIPYIYGDSS